MTYPRFAKACYASFAVAVLAAMLKLGIFGAGPAVLKILPVVPAASASAPAKAPSKEPEDPRLKSFSDDGAASPKANVSESVVRGDAGARVGAGSDSREPSYDASVFRRPMPGRDSSSGPVCGDLGAAPGSSRVVFPLPEDYFYSFDDTWGAPRPQGGHEGSDLMSPAGTPEFAVTDGRIVPVAGSNDDGWNTLGGYTVMIEAAYDVGPIKKGDLFYYAHMDGQSTLPIGAEVRAGQRIGTVGDTGEGPPVTRGKFPPHLHFGWYDANLSKERSQAESGAMDPYPLLLWLERNGGAVSGGTDASYCQAPQSPTPSTGGPDWPTPSSPNRRPDLDTGDGHSASPAIRHDAPRHAHPKRDGHKAQGDESKEENGRQQGGGKQAEGPVKAHDGAKKPLVREHPKDRVNTLRPNLPSTDFDRTVPEHPGGGQGKKGDDGRKGGEQNGKTRAEKPRKVECPVEVRPGKDQDAPQGKKPKAPAPAVSAPDRKPRPAPEETGEEAAKRPAAKTSERAAAPPDADVESPVARPDPIPNTEKAGSTTGTMPAQDGDVSAPDRSVSAAGNETGPIYERNDEE